MKGEETENHDVKISEDNFVAISASIDVRYYSVRKERGGIGGMGIASHLASLMVCINTD